jgi:integrase
MAGKLTAMFVNRATKPGRYADGGGLYLQVSRAGTKAWLFRYMLAGKSTEMGLGPVARVTLAKARELAKHWNDVRADGLDPLSERNREKLATVQARVKAKTFRQCAEAYYASHRSGWRSEKHSEQWIASLVTHAFPIIGDLPVSAIDTATVLRVLNPIWSTKHKTGKRVRERIEVVLNDAKVQGLRDGENPARWRGHLEHTLAPPKRLRATQPVKRHQAVPVDDMPALCAALRAIDSTAARALEVTILTGLRSAEVIQARWPEVDLDARAWTIPPERTKSGREHRVPLADHVLDVLRSLPRDDGYIFKGSRGERVSDHTMLRLLNRLRPGVTVHGFRSTMVAWAKDAGIPAEVREDLLAHSYKGETQAAYDRDDLFAQRVPVMERWAAFCG